MITRSVEPDELQRVLRRPWGARRNLGDERHVLACRQAGDEVVELEDEADMVAAVEREVALVERGELLVRKQSAAAGRACRGRRGC